MRAPSCAAYRRLKGVPHERGHDRPAVDARPDHGRRIRIVVRRAVRWHRDRGRDGRRSPSASKRHNRLARVLANALDTSAGPDWNADTDFDVRLQDVPLTNRRPDVVVYRADTIDVTPTRPEHVLLAAEIVTPGSETTDRVVKLDQYARAGIPFYWRVELTADPHPRRVHLPARLSEQALPRRRRIHRDRQGQRALPGRGRPVHPRVAARQEVPAVNGDPISHPGRKAYMCRADSQSGRLPITIGCRCQGMRTLAP